MPPITIAQLQKIADDYDLAVLEQGPGHFHICGGALLVNYYPNSQKRTAYVAGTKWSIPNATPEQAMKLAITPPAVQEYGTTRKRGSLERKKKMLRRSNVCHWCGCKLSLRGEVPGTVKATLEHVIPLKRGGLDNDNNCVLACLPCNNKRGHDMPELAQKVA